MHILTESSREDGEFMPINLAVLAIDPSSTTGGSILGDKTRMAGLSCHPRAFVRPSPSSGSLGGMQAYTHDAQLLCEFAGFELTIIETVGVGQSETELAECCDLFLLILAPGGGDELQGSKKGIVEAADLLVVNKADGETEDLARKTASEYKKALNLVRRPGNSRHNDVLAVSAKTGKGVDVLWREIQKYYKAAQSCGLDEKRKIQRHYWMWKYLKQTMMDALKNDPNLKDHSQSVIRKLNLGEISPRAAAQEIWMSSQAGRCTYTKA